MSDMFIQKSPLILKDLKEILLYHRQEHLDYPCYVNEHAQHRAISFPTSFEYAASVSAFKIQL